MNLKNRIFRKKVIVPFILVVIIAGAITSYCVYQHKLYYHFKAVDPGKVYRSGCLSAAGLKAVYDKTHFKTIVVVRSEAEVKENKNNWYTRETEFCKKHDLNFEFFDLGAGVPPNPEQIKRFNKIISNPEMYPIIIHCEQGVIRTGMMVAIYRVDKMGQTGQYVWDNMSRFGHDLKDYPQVKNFIVNFNMQKELQEAQKNK
jgi:protein tyrosine/serine phosphatase